MVSNVFIIILISLVKTIFSLEHYDLANFTENSKDNILCRSCGIGISSSDYIISKSSHGSQYSFTDSLFGEDDVLVQVLTNNIFFQFPVVTVKHSTCVGIGEWEENDSWFSGYHWKACLCPDCGAVVGWIFMPIEQHSIQFSEPFFGLIVTNLVAETFIDSLIRNPSVTSQE